MAITLDEIAKLAGVSRSTASRVINGQSGVRSSTRERVLQIVHEHGYHPNPEARSLAAQRFQKHPQQTDPSAIDEETEVRKEQKIL